MKKVAIIIVSILLLAGCMSEAEKKEQQKNSDRLDSISKAIESNQQRQDSIINAIRQ